MASSFFPREKRKPFYGELVIKIRKENLVYEVCSM